MHNIAKSLRTPDHYIRMGCEPAWQIKLHEVGVKELECPASDLN